MRSSGAALRDGALGGVCVLLATIFVAFAAITVGALAARAAPSAFMAALHSQVVIEALVVTLKTSLISAAIIVVFGTPLAALLSRPFWGRSLIDALVTLPVVLPPVVGGLALLLAFGRAGLLGHQLSALGLHIPFTKVAVVLAQTFVAAPLYIAVAKSVMARADPELLDAAATLRASPAYIFARVVIPPAIPALLCGLVLAWARALGEFGATITFAGNLPGVTQTMPIAVYMAAQTDLQAAIAIAVVLMILSYGALLFVRTISADAAIIS